MSLQEDYRRYLLERGFQHSLNGYVKHVEGKTLTVFPDTPLTFVVSNQRLWPSPVCTFSSVDELDLAITYLTLKPPGPAS